MNITHLMEKQSKCLLTTDQALLTNIFHSHKKAYTLPDGSEYPTFPSVEHSLLHTMFNEYEERHKLFIDFMQVIPEFARLSVNDKKCLLQNQYIESIILSNQIVSKFIPRTLVKSVSVVYDSTSGNKANQAIARLITYMNDPLLLKLVLVIQTFSNGVKRYRSDRLADYFYDTSIGIFAAQNIYVELLWRYLLSRLPSERDTVKFFNRLVLDLLFLQDAAFVMEGYVKSVPHEINQMNSLMRSLWLA